MEESSVTLNEAEKTLRRLLLDVVDFIEKNPVATSDKASQIQLPHELQAAPLTLRWTGGWVRDKLLGKHSEDIDIAINKMTGYHFGLRLKEYLDVPQNASKYNVTGSNQAISSKLAKVEANPDKSKHLETATTKILGLDIDLVNLRKETYAGDSRNPQVEFGTPEEDALRRDATINAMFYNIHNSQVEDFTKHGLSDLKDGIIRTPLEPHSTFIDDPLRVLRLIRFASRFGYKIDDATFESMKTKEIHEALLQKITKERVMTELEKMLKGPDPKMALDLIKSANLYNVVFVAPGYPEFYTPDIQNWSTVYNILFEIVNPLSNKFAIIREIAIKDKEEIFQAWFISAMVPWADAPKIPPKKPGKVPPSLAAVVLREGLKGPNKLIDLMELSVKNMIDIKRIVNEKVSKRDEIGMAIRNWGPTWGQQVLFSMLHDILVEPAETIALSNQYIGFLSLCKRLDILDAYSLKPLIDGKTLAKAMETSTGPWMKSALDVIVEWQLRNPDANDVNDAISEVRVHMDNRSKLNDGNEPLRKKIKHGELTTALVHYLLHVTLRLIFSQKRHPDLTESGRRNINTNPEARSQTLFDNDPKPWKKDPWALDLLLWVCKSLTPELVEREWGLLIPPILTILDEIDITTKAKACECLRRLLLQTPPPLLKRTGLGPIFEESLYAAASMLPTLTPESESIIIVNAAYPALLALANATHPAPAPSQPHNPARTRFLLKILRQGFISGFSYAGEHVHIATALLSQLPNVLDALGIDSVVQLKDLVPMLTAVLDDPLATTYPPLLLAAARAEEAAIRNGWPRVWFWRLNLLQGLCGVWIRITEDNGSHVELEEVKKECKEIVGMLNAAVMVSEAKDVWPGELKALVNTKKELQGLLEDLVQSED